MTTLGASRSFFAALIFTSLISIGPASAQAPTSQQSTILSPRTSQQQTTDQQPKSEQSKTYPQQETARPQDSESGEQGMVIPPAPSVIKRDPEVIVIPFAASKPEPEYQQRPVTSVKIGSLYGYRTDPFTRRARFHSGVDIKARWGDPVGASAPGIVQFAGWYHGYGNLLIVNHGGGVTTHYAHLSSFALSVGDKVARGTLVGYAGSTGRATSPHLHYEVRINDKPIDPLLPVALDPSSDYFKLSEPAAESDAVHGSPDQMIRPPSK